MKAKEIIIGVVVVAVLAAGVGLIIKSGSSKKEATKAVVVEKDAKAPEKALAKTSEKMPAKAPAPKKTFPKDMGGLTLQIVNTKSKPLSVRAKVFRSIDPKTSMYTGSLVSNRMQELARGSYDIELDTVPQKLIKGISVTNGKETIEDLGCMTGVLNVKIVDAKNKPVFYPVRVYLPKTTGLVAVAMANRPLEVLAGTYDVEIGVLPKIVETAVAIDAGKEKVLDLGVVTGTLMVKAIDENKVEKKDSRQTVKIKRSDTGEVVTSARVNRPIDLRQGSYIVEAGTIPPQITKDVKVNSGEETVVDVIIQTPAPKPVKVAAPAPAKGR